MGCNKYQKIYYIYGSGDAIIKEDAMGPFQYGYYTLKLPPELKNKWYAEEIEGEIVAPRDIYRVTADRRIEIEETIRFLDQVTEILDYLASIIEKGKLVIILEPESPLEWRWYRYTITRGNVKKEKGRARINWEEFDVDKD